VIDLRETIASPEGDINAIANVVSHEPALVARIFQLANSPFLGFRRHTDSLAEAVSRLGATLVETLAVSLLLKIPGDRVPESVHRKIAEEALALGSVARMLAKALGRSLHEQDKVFVASLLTSIGSLVLLEEGVEQSDLSHCYGLEEKYDDDHVVAAYVLILWGYDIELGEIILNQNTVNFSSDQHIVELASLVGAASYLKQCQTQQERDTFIGNQPISVQDALNEIVLTLLDEVTH
jgi:HD-like signal output (HDOD) protein